MVKLTQELVLRSPAFINPLNDRELDLRGIFIAAEVNITCYLISRATVLCIYIHNIGKLLGRVSIHVGAHSFVFFLCLNLTAVRKFFTYTCTYLRALLVEGYSLTSAFFTGNKIPAIENLGTTQVRIWFIVV